MAELTLSISDELATRLEPLRAPLCGSRRDRLPQLLESVLEIADKETLTPSQESLSFPLENTVYALSVGFFD